MEKHDQEKRKLLTQVQEMNREEEGETSRPSPRSNKDWTPGKEAVLAHTRNTLFSSQAPEKLSKTDELKGLLTGNMSKLEETHKVLNEQLSTLGLESDQEGDGEMLSLTTHLAAKYPDLLDGDYETRVEILNNLTKK